MTDEKTSFRSLTKGFWESRFARIDEINKKYAEPQIKMTQGVKLALLLLRLYLLFLVVLLAYKFVTILAGGGKVGI